tara:strand:+ start:27900 stop:29153 length:1254 start_codon:yes stop_codon:yes gene_type:complete
MNNGVPGNQFGEFAQPGQNAQQKTIEVYAQSLAQQHRVAMNNNTASPQGMNSGVQGSPMAQSGLDGQHDMFAGNGPRPGMPAAAPGAPQQGNHALQDYQMQLMLLEQQNKKRLLMARQEQDNMTGPQHQGGVGAQGFPAAMSPQGNRPGPSPNPADQMKRGTPKLGQMPGSPLPEGTMQPQRGSPAPNMQFDPNLAPPGMPPQFYPQMPHQSPMMRPPSSHPGANFNGQQLTPQQVEAMRNGQMQQNGAWRGGPQQPGMMPGQQMNGPMGNNPQQRQMPPPPAPATDQPRPEPSPSQSNQAPPTPSQSSKAGPGKKKGTKDNVKVKLRASRLPLSFVDIDFRSPQIRRGQMQVQLQQRQVAKNHPRRHHRLQWRRLRRIRSNRLTKMASRNRYSSSPSNNNRPWISLHSATASMELT